MHRIGIIGGGNMGEAVIGSCVRRFTVGVCEKNKKRCRYLKKKYRISLRDLEQLSASYRIIILAVKPQDMSAVLKELKPFITKGHLIISIAAGITSNFIEKRLGKGVRIIRTMPNLPALINEGITAVSKGKYARTSDILLACNILKGLGKTVIVQEKSIDAITATSGSGPGYVFFFMEGMIKAAKSLGLNDQLANELVKTTFKGSSRLIESLTCDPAVMRAKVTSKGGTTKAAVDVFMKRNIHKIIKEALTASKKRAEQLSRS